MLGVKRNRKEFRRQRETRPISDANKLVWVQFAGAIQAASDQLNIAIRVAHDTVASQIIKAEGLDPEQWQFDVTTLKMVARPKATDALGQ